MGSMYLSFVHSYIALKLEMEKQIEEKITMRLKNDLSNYWLMVTLILSSDDVRNCTETTLVKDSHLQFV